MSQVRPLRWRAYTPPPPALPEGVLRTFVPTANGDLELLCSIPENSSHRPALVFVHGASCSAMCYNNWLPFFSAAGYPSFSISTRGRGQSWKPSFLSMTFTFKKAFAQDITACIKYVRSVLPLLKSGEDVILVGHSLGGGLSQYVLSNSMTPAVSRLVLVAAAPAVGAFEIFKNWEKIDPDMNKRSWENWFHPRITLMSAELIKNAFFSKRCPDEIVRDFELATPEFESTATGLSILFPFGQAEKILANINGENGRKVFLMAGGDDVLVNPDMVRRHAEWYRKALPDHEKPDAITMIEIPRVAHHIMLDMNWKKAADELLRWLEGQ